MATQTKKARPRIYARNRRAYSRRGNENLFESDGTYFLKLIAIVILGAVWVKFKTPLVWNGINLYGIPVGLVIGAAVIGLFEKYQIDRKIWYAVLVIVTVLCFFAPAIIYV